MEGKSAAYRQAVGAAIHQAMVDTINIPEQDRFQVITEHKPDGLIYDPSYFDIQRTDDIIFVQITMRFGRTVEQKKALYARICELLVESPGVRSQDVFINLVEVAIENWSFGNGIAQYAS
jgi:phenylpyruvate tautomerase PptA (4-oxalocrotonate tautomerase family)